MKKILLFCIALVAGAGFVFAEEGDCDCCRIDGYLYWNLRWSGKTAEVTTPQYLWYYQAEFNEITIPETVENEAFNEKQTYYTRGIAPNTFYDCKNITSVTPPPMGMNYIGASAFEGCTGLTSFTVKVNSLGSRAFQGCTGLETVNLVDIQTIGAEAFSGCAALSSLFIYPTVETIGEKAFEECTSLTSFTLPASVTNLGANAFRRCTGISVFEVDSDNPNYMAENGIIYSKDKTAIIAYPYGKSGAYHIPHSVQSIGAGTFSQDANLTSVSTGNGVTTIGSNAFYGCSGLTSAVLGNNVATIGEYAFSDCSALTSIEIPNGVTTIGAFAFGGCSGMTSVTIGTNVDSIGQMAFFGCGSVTSITCHAATPPKLGLMVFGGMSGNEGLDPTTCVLYVPKDAIDAYKAADQWENFTHIEAITPVIFSSTDGSGGVNVNENHSRLVDGKYHSANWTKWCANGDHKSVPTGESGDACWWVDFEASTAIDINHYILTTGNDNASYGCSERNPKDWVLKAKLNEGDAWTTIATVTNDTTMQDVNFTDFAFILDVPGTYQFFRFEVLATRGSEVLQLCELRFSIGDGSQPASDVPEGAFTVDYSGKVVYFSKGNLQATTTDLGAYWTWEFATNPWDYIGFATANTKISGNGTVSANGTVDLFGWSTAATYYGIHYSDSNNDYSGDFVDWGATMGANWRTLTKDEWHYLFYTRMNAWSLRSQGTVNGVHGYILLPDAWTTPSGLSFEGNSDNWTTNVYAGDDWTAMQNAGAVFLPAAGSRSYAVVSGVGNVGGYWSATTSDGTRAGYMEFGKDYEGTDSFYARSQGRSVRLVSETAPTPGPATAIDNTDDQESRIGYRKSIVNGQLLILRGGKCYTIQGQEVGNK